MIDIHMFYDPEVYNDGIVQMLRGEMEQTVEIAIGKTRSTHRLITPMEMECIERSCIGDDVLALELDIKFGSAWCLTDAERAVMRREVEIQIFADLRSAYASTSRVRIGLE